MTEFYRAVKAAFEDSSVVLEASDAAEELEKIQESGINCEHCKHNGSGANACKECSLYWLAPVDQRKPLNYEPF